MQEMSEADLLAYAIDLAIENGWVVPKGLDTKNYRDVIFNQEFAKAIWGEGEIDTGLYHIPEWQYNLQAMVVSKDPIAYLGESIHRRYGS